MKKHSFYFGLLAVLLAVTMIAATLINAGAASNGIPESEISAIVNTTTDTAQISSPFIEVANKVTNSVVGVNNYTNASTYYGYGFGYGFDRQRENRETKQGFGSGVVISNYGHVLTNYHVIENASKVTVTTNQDDQEHAATVVGYDADLDIAVLYAPDINLPAVELGDSDKLQVGEWAIVIGNPLSENFARTMTVGVVSGLDRQVKDTTRDRYGRRTTITNTMIQVDAAINSGNSGGGMFNTLGQLQGIPERKYTSSATLYTADVDNIGMCIPINVAKPLIEQVLRDFAGTDVSAAPEQKSENSASREQETNSILGKPRLGVTVTSFNRSISMLPQGAVVRAVDDNSPAQEAGMQVGDIIVQVDGDVISSYTELTKKIAEYKEGDTLAIKVYRDEALAKQMDQNQIDLTDVGNGSYVDLNVTLRVIDDMNM